MDSDDLRKAFLKEQKSPKAEAGPIEGCPNPQTLTSMLMREATDVQAEYRATADAPKRRRLQDRYKTIDAALSELKQYDDLSREEQQKLRERLYRKYVERGRTSRLGEDRRHAELEEIEKGRRRIVEAGKAGANQNTFKRIRNELNYLLGNYDPAYDGKIETLIEQWRTSGDPEYDPAIKITYRNARRKKANFDYPI